MSVQKCYLKSIRLYPTLFHVDVWICSDLDLLANQFSRRYGASVEYYKEDLELNSTQDIKPTANSELKGDYTIVVNMQKLDLPTLVHELNHVFYHLLKIIGVKISMDNSEWHSYMLEYLYEETKDIKTFKMINNE